MVCSNSSTKEPALCRLLWRQEKLWVVPPSARNQHVALPALAQPEWFRACLERSKAKAVVVDPSLGNEVISFWALACAESNKSMYLRLPTMGTMPEKQKAVAWRIKCTIERAIGLGLLLALSPLILAFVVLLNMQGEGSALIYHWCIGQRGRLFTMTQFRSELVVSRWGISISRLLEISRLDRLPRLLNVVRGEMALVGTKPWRIEDALKVPNEYRTCLKAMPGILGPRPIGSNIPTFDIEAIAQSEIEYLETWSFWADGKLILKVLITGADDWTKARS